MTTKIGLPMPQPGETITEGLVVRWLKSVGDVIAEKEAVVELETAKAIYDYESPIAGKLLKIITEAGSEQKVGRPLAIVECDETAAKKYLRLGVGLEVDASGEVVNSGEAKIGATAGGGNNSAADLQNKIGKSASAEESSGARKLYPPLIRSLAAEHGLSDQQLENISATGVGGRLTKDDLLKYLQTSGVTSKSASNNTQQVGRELPPSLSGAKRVESDALRRRIAENMILSKSTIPHAGTAVEVDMSALLKRKSELAEEFQKKHNTKLRLTPFFIEAVRDSLKKYKACNNFYFVDAQGKHWIEEHDFIHIGMAVGTKRGLMVAVLKNVQDLSFVELAQKSNDLMDRAMEGKLKPDELTGGTITINNPGALGSIRGNQIISYPQSMIVGFHALQERVKVLEGKVVPYTRMELDCSFDHRIVDGVEAVGFLSAVRDCLEKA